MKSLVVVENVARWPLRLQGAEVVSARDYLSRSEWAGERGARVFNLCRTYGYQTLGYYVSLLAAARGHRPIPTVETLQDLRLSPVVRVVSEQLDELIQRSFARLRGSRFELSIYFGRNLARRYERLSRALFDQFPAPFLRASFERHEGRWELTGVRLIATSEIPDAHRDFVIAQAEAWFERRRPRSAPRAKPYRYDLAILADPEAEDAPSDERALRRFERAARDLGVRPLRIGRDDYVRVAEFDALFLRETTYVDHHTYRFARRAAAEGLVVIDDPESILRCTNKVFQAELFSRLGIPSPRTAVVHEANVDTIADAVGLPCVLKTPDGSFSRGVVRVESPEELVQRAKEFLQDSELLVAQAWTPSAFDWRIGVLGGEALWACRYHMARGHWQIAADAPGGRRRYGRVEALALDAVPARVVDVAVRAARAMGDGLYGVDLKQVGDAVLVLEVNDNPNVEAGYEDAVLGDELYRQVLLWFRARLDARGSARR